MLQEQRERVTIVLETLNIRVPKKMSVTFEFVYGSQSVLSEMLIPVEKGKAEYQLFKERIHLHLPYNRSSNVAM